MSKIKLSEIRARQSDPLSADIVHLLELVERMGKALEPLANKWATLCDQCSITVESDGSVSHEDSCPIPEARALLLEIKECAAWKKLLRS